MGIQLNAVKNFCEEGFKNFKLIPLSFKFPLKFPLFEITESTYKEAVIEVIAEKVRLAIDYGKYRHSAFDKKVGYNDLLEAQKAKLENRASKIQEEQFAYAEKILPIQMKKDSNMNYDEIQRKSLIESCTSRLKYSLANIEFMFDPFEKSIEVVNEKNKFAATMIMLKELMPLAYRQIKLSLQDYPNKSLINELKELEESPNTLVIGHIYKINPEIVEKNFPKEARYLRSLDDAFYEINNYKKLIKYN